MVGLFESTIAQFTALAALLPVVAGQSGNAGAQALAMVISMFAAGLAGALVPMVLRRIGQDPATASSIILTTLTDVVGFFSFLGIAALFAPSLATGSCLASHRPCSRRRRSGGIQRGSRSGSELAEAPSPSRQDHAAG